MDSPNEPRRSQWVDTRRRIRASARELFASRGYRGTTTRQLAEHAGVSLMTLHRHFPRKADLFEDAVLGPMEDFLDEYLASREQRGVDVLDSRQEIAILFDGLFEALIGQQRTLAAAALAFNEHDGPVSADLRRRYDAFLTAFEDAVRDRIGAYGLPAEPRLTSRILIGMALGVASHTDLLFPTGPQPTRH